MFRLQVHLPPAENRVNRVSERFQGGSCRCANGMASEARLVQSPTHQSPTHQSPITNRAPSHSHSLGFDRSILQRLPKGKTFFIHTTTIPRSKWEMKAET